MCDFSRFIFLTSFTGKKSQAPECSAKKNSMLPAVLETASATAPPEPSFAELVGLLGAPYIQPLLSINAHHLGGVACGRVGGRAGGWVHTRDGWVGAHERQSCRGGVNTTIAAAYRSRLLDRGAYA